ncbi:MAG TPA: hypothetical protein VMH37_17435 [Candidatus Binataceae bacterium]|nr:hypothetical protein [Candidatus Binataceae bacterium]
MKSLPIALSALMLVALPAWGTAARAGVPIEVSAPAGDDPPNPVLEIPQSCSSEDGTENPCPAKDSTTASTDPSAPDGSLRDDASVREADGSFDAVATPAPDADGSVAAAPAATPAPDADAATASADLGNAQDYQQQANVDNTAALPNYGYPQTDPSLRMPTILVAPVAVGSFVGSAPYVAPTLPASGPIMMPRPAMIYVPRPVAPLMIGRPMFARPMTSMGVPHTFRVH